MSKENQIEIRFGTVFKVRGEESGIIDVIINTMEGEDNCFSAATIHETEEGESMFW